VVTAAVGSTTTGIDFELEKMGSLAGALTRATDGLETHGTVEVFDASGSLVATKSVYGDYEVTGLPTGSYHVKGKGSGAQSLSSRLYDDVPCPEPCDVTTGTSVAVVMGSATAGVDIALPAGGEIQGFIGAAVGPLTTGVLLAVFGTDGSPADYQWTFGGPYTVEVPEGSYFVMVLPEEEYQGQIYAGINCPSSCPLDLATPVVVQAGATISAIDFALEPLTGIVGQVVDSQDQPVPGVAIDLWSSSGAWLASATTGPSGRYRLTPSAGSYFVSTDNGLGAVDQVWLGVACPFGPAYLGLCDPLDGDVVNLSWDGLMTGVDFALEGVPLFADGFETGDTSAWSP
jgi:hypothetical protein